MITTLRKIKINFIVIILILFNSINTNILFAENNNNKFDLPDSLYTKVKNDNHIFETVLDIANSKNLQDTIIHIINLNWNSHYYVPQVGIYYADKLINKYYTEINPYRIKLYETYLGKLYSVKAHCHHTMWENDSSYHYFSKSIYYRLKTGDVLEKIWAYNNITLHFNKVGNADSSAYYLHNAVALLKQNTKYFHFTYDSHFFESKINSYRGTLSLIHATYQDLLFNYHRLGMISENNVFVNTIGKYNEYKKLMNEFGYYSFDDDIYTLLKQVFFLNNGIQYDHKNLDILNYQKKYNYYLKNNEMVRRNNILKLYNFINNLRDNDSKLTLYDWKKENVDTTIYYNPLEKVLFKLIEVKYSEMPIKSKRDILIKEYEKILPKLNFAEKGYLLRIYAEVFKNELNKYKHFEKHIYNFESEHNEIANKYQKNKTIKNSIIEFNDFQKFLLSGVDKYNVERFTVLIGIIIVIALILLLAIILLFKNRQLTKSAVILNKQLSERNFINQKMYSVISHDLSAPISYFEYYLNEISKNFQNNNQLKALEQIESLKNKSNFISNTLESMLDYLKFEDTKIELIYESTNLSEIVLEVKNLNINYLNDKNIEIQTKGIENEIYTEKTFISIIIRNLLQNSIKFSKPNSIIIVELSNIENQTIIKIIDFGIGITPKRRDAILNGIPITAGVDTNNKQSSAFGFLLVRDLVIKLGGNINIEDNSPCGTIVIITLPNKTKVKI